MTQADLEQEYTTATIDWAEQTLQLTDAEIAAAATASRATLRRWRQRTGVPSSAHRRALERLNQLRHLLESEFDSMDVASEMVAYATGRLCGPDPSLVDNEWGS